jgi:hypothetical protein
MRLDPDEQQVPTPAGGGDVAAPMPRIGMLVRPRRRDLLLHDKDCECHVLEVWPVGVVEETDAESNGHEGAGILYELAEFEFTELIKAVPLEHFHFSQRRAIFEIGWKEFGRDLELRVHIEPDEADEGS